MKKWFEDEMGIQDMKQLLRGLSQTKKRNNTFMVVGIVVSVVLAVVGLVLVFRSLNNNKEDDDWDMDDEGFCDENGCYYTSDDDFEEE